MVNGNVERGKWCTLEGEFTVPEDADVSKVRIFPETIGWKASYKEEDLITYYMDDVSFRKTGADADEPEDVIDPATQIKLEAGTTKTPGRNNPLIDYQFGADPYAMEYNGRVYVYMTNDSQQFDATEKDDKGLSGKRKFLQSYQYDHSDFFFGYGKLDKSWEYPGCRSEWCSKMGKKFMGTGCMP